jgi:hypothetical protein
VPTKGGVTTISGTNFGDNSTLILVNFLFPNWESVKLQTCAAVAFVTPHTMISCTMPSGVGATMPLVVTVAGQLSANITSMSGVISYEGIIFLFLSALL